MNVNKKNPITSILKQIFFFQRLKIYYKLVLITIFFFKFPRICFFIVDFDQSCDDFTSYTIYDDDTYYIRWKGATPKLYSTCSYKFSPFDTDYKVCVEAKSLFISDCSVKLQYYGGLIGNLLERV